MPFNVSLPCHREIRAIWQYWTWMRKNWTVNISAYSNTSKALQALIWRFYSMMSSRRNTIISILLKNNWCSTTYWNQRYSARQLHYSSRKVYSLNILSTIKKHIKMAPSHFPKKSLRPGQARKTKVRYSSLFLRWTKIFVNLAQIRNKRCWRIQTGK